jgi:hypothetical protein
VIGQTSAIDAEQQAYQEWKAKDREARARELWRWMLSKPIGREFLFTQVLEVVGPFRTIDPVQPQGDVALHNLGFDWLIRIQEHRDLYLQMVDEHLKRQKEDREEREAKRQEWQQQYQENGYE